MSTSAPSALASGLRSRCPACGEGPLFEGFLRVRPVCPVCGTDLQAQGSGDGPAAFIIFIVGAVVLAGVLVTEVRYEPPVWVHLVLWLPLTIILALALMRPFKATLIALQYKHRRDDFDASP